MDLRDTPDEAAFRQEVRWKRSWIPLPVPPRGSRGLGGVPQRGLTNLARSPTEGVPPPASPLL